jgi:multidrug efflux system membrane fusion protein
MARRPVDNPGTLPNERAGRDSEFSGGASPPHRAKKRTKPMPADGPPPIVPEPDDMPPRPRPRRAWPWVLVAALVIAGAGAWYWHERESAAPVTAADGRPGAGNAGQGGGKGGGPGGGRRGADPRTVLPVAVAPARAADFTVWINALGNVAARNTVTVRPRVDGQLSRVLFREGQLVKAGELLAEIDPRPFEVQVAQANGQLARDQAQLANARIDLERYRTLLKQDSIAQQQVDTQAALVRQFEGTIEADKGAVDNAKLQLSFTRITAPAAGRLGLRQVDAGNMVRQADTNGIRSTCCSRFPRIASRPCCAACSRARPC